ncbi:MAG: adenylate/guanylate cyclase domain-containing protein, partial [Gemmatimonadota bacterium]
YSRLASEDERAALRSVELLHATAREAVERYRGRVVKCIGDAVLAEFPSTEAAVRAALGECPLRIGIHVGDVARAADDDLYGDGVNIAARIQKEAEPGEVLVTDDVRRQLRARPEFHFTPRGERELRGHAGVMAVHGVAMEGAADAGWHVRPSEGAGTRSAAAGRSSSRRRVIQLGLGAAMAILVVTLLPQLLRRGDDAAVPPPMPAGAVVPASTEAPSAQSIAVLPFVDLSAEQNLEHFTDGITEEVIHALANASDLDVASRTSAFAYKGRVADVREIGRELNVATVMEGSVRRAGDTVRITAQLINVRDGYHLWSATYERELSDVFAVQDEVAGEITRAVGEKFHQLPAWLTLDTRRPR